jgi:ornithine cyclodeaminase/alanine dehydrogenase-like protein (mu-crystallin family)
MTLLLTGGDVAALLTLEACIEAVERAFVLQAEGHAVGPGVLGLHVPDGGFHVKAAGLRLSRLYVATKLNANFPGNGPRWGLPAIQGVVALSDGESGRLLALMDSMEITALRTGAATAVAARHLARPDVRVATIVGCGRQGRARADVRPELPDVVAGRKTGRGSADDIIVFDSTGVAIEDVAAAAVVYESALATGRGVTVDLGR